MEKKIGDCVQVLSLHFWGSFILVSTVNSCLLSADVANCFLLSDGLLSADEANCYLLSDGLLSFILIHAMNNAC